MAGTKHTPVGNGMANTAPLTSTPVPGQGAGTIDLTGAGGTSYIPNLPSHTYIYNPQFGVMPTYPQFPQIKMPPSPPPRTAEQEADDAAEAFLALMLLLILHFDDYKQAVGFLIAVMRHHKNEFAGPNANNHAGALDQHAANANQMSNSLAAMKP